MDVQTRRSARKVFKERQYFPKDFFGDSEQVPVQALLPKYRKKRRQVKSVDAVNKAMVQSSNEFSKVPNESGVSLHKRRTSERTYSLYQSPKILIKHNMQPGNSFLRRNFSEQKGAFPGDIKSLTREGYTKPLSLMSSLKKFEIDPKDIVAKDIKSIEPRKLLKQLPANMPKTVVAKDGSQKKLFFSKRKILKFEDSPRNNHFLSENKNLKTRRRIVLPKIEDTQKLPKIQVKGSLDISNKLVPSKNATLKMTGESDFLTKCEKGLFNPWARQPVEHHKKSVSTDEFYKTAYFGGNK